MSVAADVESLRALLAPLAAVAELQIEWLVTNMDRVDAGVTGDDREWRVVYRTDEDGLVAALWVHERPPRFDGLVGGRSVVVNGPSGSGKSSLMTALVDLASTPWVMFDELSLGTVKEPYLIWRDSAPALQRGFLAGIAALAEAGNQVTLSSGGVPFDVLRGAFAGIPTVFVGLDCPLPILLERERGRPGRWGGLAEESLGVHNGWTYDVRIDTSTVAPSDAAQQVLDLVDNAPLRGNRP